MKWDFKLRLNGISTEKIHRTQTYVDSEILRRSDSLVPFDTGSLKRSGITGTRIGTGVIKYTAPYAKRQYFAGKASGQRGRKWVKRMWLSQGKDIIKNTNKILNGK
ncbi:MAG: minor capsid protein [Ruminococcus sp.]|nr:minor capsid protein [Ruminococcus sp.]